MFALAGAHPGSPLFADAGHRGREHKASLRLVGVELIVPERHRLGERPPAETSKARIRLVIASGFATLKGQMRLEDHERGAAARPPRGAASASPTTLRRPSVVLYPSYGNSGFVR